MSLYRTYDPKRKHGAPQSDKAWAASRINYALFQVRSMWSKISSVQNELQNVQADINAGKLPREAKALLIAVLDELVPIKEDLRKLDRRITAYNKERPNHKKPKEDFYDLPF